MDGDLILGHGTKCSCCRVNTTKAKHTCEAQRVSTWAKLVSGSYGYTSNLRCTTPTDTHHYTIYTYASMWTMDLTEFILLADNFTDLASLIYHQAPLSHFNSSTPLSDVHTDEVHAAFALTLWVDCWATFEDLPGPKWVEEISAMNLGEIKDSDWMIFIANETSWKSSPPFLSHYGSMGRLYTYLHEWFIFMVNVGK